jgi:predicted O-methyltransferase YrrM
LLTNIYKLAHANERAAALHKHLLSLPAEQLQGKPWNIVTAIEDFSNAERVPMLFGQAKINVVRDVLNGLKPKPKVIVEFGTFVGNSAVAWGAILRELNGPEAEGLRVYGFEMDPKLAQMARDLVKLAGLDDIVSVLEGPGSESLKQLHSEGKVLAGKLDMVFIDHWEKFYVPDLKLCEELKLFHVGSVAVADNTDFPGAPDYVEYVKKGGDGAVRYESESLPAAGATRAVRRLLFAVQ